MIRSSFFNSIAGDRKYNALNFAEYFNSFIGNGVFPTPTNGLQVISNNDMTVTVLEGRAWINGYLLINDDNYILTLDVADGLLKRIDRVVARLDFTTREIRIDIKKGAFASSPIAPTLQRDADAYELGIADILISNGVVSIVTANITDLRLNADLCGRVDSLIAGDMISLVQDLENHKAESALKHITESGSNVNGSYIKFDEGTMICTHLITAQIPTGGIVWTFPGSFIAIPFTSIHVVQAYNETMFLATLNDVSNVSGKVYGRNLSGTIVLMNPDVRLFAIGRWK